METFLGSGSFRVRMSIILCALINFLLLSCSKNGADVNIVPESHVNTGFAVEAEVMNAKVGSISRNEFWDLPGNDIGNLDDKLVPNAITAITSLEENPSKENYGSIIQGFIYPPTSGNYTFWVSADDAAELWISSNADSVNKVKIAYTLSWTNSHEWTKFASQQSKSIALKSGQKYYIEVRHKQGGGGNNLSVQWRMPDNSIESPIPGKRLSPWDVSAVAAQSSNAINLDNVHGITISGKRIAGGEVACINLTNCSDIHITGNNLSESREVGIHLYNCKNITIDNNFFTNVSSGVYAEQTTAGGIKVIDNQFLNMKGPFPRGQFVQFNNVSGPNCMISRNKGENILGQSYPEDAISLYQSKGTPASPIIIDGNWIRGGGPSASGGGIMLGDRGGAYLVAKNNILVDPGEFGMAIAGGDHISIINNSIYGKSQYFTNVGLYINDIGGFKTTNCTIGNNKVRYYNKTNYQNNAWIALESTKPSGWDTNIFGADIDASILPKIIIDKK